MSKFQIRINASNEAGNIFVVLGTAIRLMKKLGVDQADITKLTEKVGSAKSYSEAVDAVREWFPVSVDEEVL